MDDDRARELTALLVRPLEAEARAEAARCDGLLAVLAARLSEMEETLLERTLQLAAVHRSRSWKVTAPLRWIAIKLRSARRVSKAALAPGKMVFLRGAVSVLRPLVRFVVGVPYLLRVARRVLACWLALEAKLAGLTVGPRPAVALFSTVAPALAANAFANEPSESAAHYRLALACCRVGRYDDARRYIELSDLPDSGDFGLLHHYVHLALCQALAAHQEEAISAGKPAILLTALPRSASSFLSTCISEIVGVPIFRVSVGGFDDGRIVRKWAMQVSRGGATTHDHFPGQVANIEALAQAGIRKIFIQIRDPRAAWWSFIHRAVRSSDVTSLASSPLDWYGNAIKWLPSWIEVAWSSDGPFQISFVSYDDVRLRLTDTIERSSCPGEWCRS